MVILRSASECCFSNQNPYSRWSSGPVGTNPNRETDGSDDSNSPLGLRMLTFPIRILTAGNPPLGLRMLAFPIRILTAGALRALYERIRIAKQVTVMMVILRSRFQSQSLQQVLFGPCMYEY